MYFLNNHQVKWKFNTVRGQHLDSDTASGIWQVPQL